MLISLKDDLGHVLSPQEQELITSITSGGALVGAVFAGLVADRFGRKQPLYWGCFLFTVGAIIQAAAFTVAQMTVGRFIVGLGVGSAAMVIPLYIGEMAPAKYRGRMIAFDNMSVTLGQLISYGFGAAFADVNKGWRYSKFIVSFEFVHFYREKLFRHVLRADYSSETATLYHNSPDFYVTSC